MKILKLVVGELNTNCYIVYDEKSKNGFVIDPGGNSEKIIQKAKGLNINYIINTHGHFDHIAANRKIKEMFKAKIAISVKDAPMLTSSLKNYSAVLGYGRIRSPKADLLLNDGDIINIGKLNIKVISIPGHSPGSIALLVKNDIFTGDIIFKNAYGLTLNKGDRQVLVEGIKTKIFKLPGKIVIYPGHAAKTTIGQEKKRKLY